MIAQYYSILLQDEDPMPEIGSPIFDDELETLIGFIYDVQPTYMDIVLLEPENLDFEPYKVLDMTESWEYMLVKVVERSKPTIKNYWGNLLTSQHLFKRTLH